MNQPTMTTDERMKQYMNFMPEMLTESTIISKLGEASFFEVPASIKYHGALSVILAQRLISLTKEEIACIRWHMGAFEHDLTMWNYYGSAIEMYPNVLYSHTADMIASRIVGV